MALTALEPIYSAGVELADTGSGLPAWIVTLVSAQDYDPLFVDGYLLEGTNAAVTVSDNTINIAANSTGLGVGSHLTCRNWCGGWACKTLCLFVSGRLVGNGKRVLVPRNRQFGWRNS